MTSSWSGGLLQNRGVSGCGLVLVLTGSSHGEEVPSGGPGSAVSAAQEKREWLPEDHPVWLVIRAVGEHMDTSAFHAGRKMGGAGTAGSRANLLHVTHTIAAEHRARRRLPRGPHPA